MLELDTIRRSTSLAVCWAPIRMMPEAAAAFGDVQQHVLDRAVALPRRVLVELVDHGEQQAARPGGLLAGGLRGEHDADHEALRAFPQVVQVDDGDLLVAGGDLPGAGVRQVGADQVAQRLAATSAAGG